MNFSRTRFWLVVLGLVALYWIPAWFFPEEARRAVNAGYFVLSLATTFLLFPDTLDIWSTRASRISWQAALAKVGIFVLMVSFAAQSLWAFIITLQGFPDDLVKSPVGTFLRYTMGIGVGMVFLGFNSAGELRPNVTVRATALAMLACGIIIGLAIGHLP